MTISKRSITPTYPPVTNDNTVVTHRNTLLNAVNYRFDLKITYIANVIITAFYKGCGRLIIVHNNIPAALQRLRFIHKSEDRQTSKEYRQDNIILLWCSFDFRRHSEPLALKSEVSPFSANNKRNTYAMPHIIIIPN